MIITGRYSESAVAKMRDRYITEGGVDERLARAVDIAQECATRAVAPDWILATFANMQAHIEMLGVRTEDLRGHVEALELELQELKEKAGFA